MQSNVSSIRSVKLVYKINVALDNLDNNHCNTHSYFKIQAAMLFYTSRHAGCKLEKVGTVTGLRIYPLKSSKAVKVDHISCAHSGVSHGVLGDRYLVFNVVSYLLIGYSIGKLV